MERYQSVEDAIADFARIKHCLQSEVSVLAVIDIDRESCLRLSNATSVHINVLRPGGCEYILWLSIPGE